jgi:hypothetical protein
MTFFVQNKSVVNWLKTCQLHSGNCWTFCQPLLNSVQKRFGHHTVKVQSARSNKGYCQNKNPIAQIYKKPQVLWINTLFPVLHSLFQWQQNNKNGIHFLNLQKWTRNFSSPAASTRTSGTSWGTSRPGVNAIQSFLPTNLSYAVISSCVWLWNTILPWLATLAAYSLSDLLKGLVT